MAGWKICKHKFLNSTPGIPEYKFTPRVSDKGQRDSNVYMGNGVLGDMLCKTKYTNQAFKNKTLQMPHKWHAV